MASQANHDSALQFSFDPNAGGEGGAPPTPPQHGNLPPGTELPPNSLPLPVFDLLSDHPLPDLPDEASVPASPTANVAAGIHPSFGEQTPAAPRGPGELWMEGDVLMCGCPKCRAPMSVRIWLMTADCWQCETGIELTEEQERQAQRLLKQREKKAAAAPVSRPVPVSRPAPATPIPDKPRSETPRPNRPPPRRPAAEPQAPPMPRRTASSARTEQRISRLKRAGAVQVWLSELLRMTPAWLISLVFHCVLLTILALLNVPRDLSNKEIKLSLEVSPARSPGGQVLLEPQKDDKFDLPIPQNTNLKDPKVRQSMVKANQDAREIRLDPDAPNPELPDLQQVKKRIGDSRGARSALAARDPRVRTEMVRREGGTTLTEAAVARGLRWMSKHQNADGSWSLHAFNRAGKCNCSGHGGIRSDAAGTALVLLPYLGAGQSHLTGFYKDTVSKGLRWMVQHQKPDGDLRADSAGNAGMYAHGQGAIVLCEAFAMTGDEKLRIPAQKAIDFIVEAQHPAGGWRYTPKQPGDTSVVGWQLMALQSARVAGLTVPDETFALADQYLDSVQSIYRPRNPRERDFDGAVRYSYIGRNAPTETMTAEALLCRVYLGWTKDEPGFIPSTRWLLKQHPPSPAKPNIYYWYYASQVMHHVGGKQWDDWNIKMRDTLIRTQETRGHAAGSWTPRGRHAPAGGRLYMTALSTCTLEVYYRHLPIFRQLDLNEREE